VAAADLESMAWELGLLGLPGSQNDPERLHTETVRFLRGIIVRTTPSGAAG